MCKPVEMPWDGGPTHDGKWSSRWNWHGWLRRLEMKLRTCKVRCQLEKQECVGMRILSQLPEACGSGWPWRREENETMTMQQSILSHGNNSAISVSQTAHLQWIFQQMDSHCSKVTRVSVRKSISNRDGNRKPLCIVCSAMSAKLQEKLFGMLVRCMVVTTGMMQTASSKKCQDGFLPIRWLMRIGSGGSFSPWMHLFFGYEVPTHGSLPTKQ